MLVVFPFEVDFYKSHDVQVSFVGHPLLDELPQTLLSEKEKIEKEAKSLIDAEEKKHKAEVEELRKSISQLQQENDALMHTVKGLNTETGCSSGPIGRKSTD